jgi:hypothetical protein
LGKFVYVRENKTKPHQAGHWSEKKRLEALTTWLALGNIRMTAAQINVPYETVKKWYASEWWKETVESLRNEETQVLDNKLSKAMDKALEKVTDMLDNGEYIYDQKTGKVKRMPVKLRDANVAFNNLLDKRQLIRKLPTKITEASNTQAQLQNLADQFAAFVKGKEIKEKQIELVDDYIDEVTVEQGTDGKYYIREDDDAVHDQREAGLQEGTVLGTLQEKESS